MGSFAHPSSFTALNVLKPGMIVRYSARYLMQVGGETDADLRDRRGVVQAVSPDGMVEVAWRDAPEMPRSVRAMNLEPL